MQTRWWCVLKLGIEKIERSAMELLNLFGLPCNHHILKSDSCMKLGSYFIKDTRKYPLRGYILGVLTHTTALD